MSEALTQGIADLMEMVPCHHFAEQALNILRYLAKKWNMDVDMGGGGGRALPADEYDRLVRPYTSSFNLFAPNVGAEDFVCRWGDALGREAAEGLENPLFWPFPMQGRPLLATGDELAKAGFAVL